ncbi:IS1380 family transposase, partial [Psychromicrobium xiongbiense]|uniref:IS1380 family transposase n=1 Tax=Psychromicrobium xiongbiense TaxID=3051184 RepID=UPI003B219ACC
RRAAPTYTLNCEEPVYGLMASDPTVSRLFKVLATLTPGKTLSAINKARAAARARVWAAAGDASPLHNASSANPVVIDLDATLVSAHSKKEQARPTWKKGYGFHPLAAFIDHGGEGTGEPLAMILRPGNAGSNTATDHIQVVKDALKQLPPTHRSGRKIMIRTDSAGGTQEFLHWLSAKHRNLGYSVGFPIHGAVENVLPLIPETAWARAYNSDGFERDGAWVTGITDMLELSAWPQGLRVIVRKEIPHPGAQLRITDIDGMRYTAFATNQARGQLADLEVRHRLRARCEDRIRGAKDTGLTNLPLRSFAANTLWCHLVMLATEITAWAQMLAFAGTKAKRWEPKKLRARVFEIAGKISHHARQTLIHLPRSAPETTLLIKGLTRLRTITPP